MQPAPGTVQSFAIAFGWVNLVYIGTAAAIGFFIDRRIFIAAMSWVHYLKYIHQYYFRAAKGSAERYKAWKRDVLLYKSISLSILFIIYFQPYVAAYRGGLAPDLDLVSVAMVISGYCVSMAATNALGVDGTYFGIELGFVKADYGFVETFPYNTIPHPMILSQVLALLGLFKPAHVHSQWPWLIPVHILLYFVHMTQEIFDFWKGDPWYKKGN